MLDLFFVKLLVQRRYEALCWCTAWVGAVIGVPRIPTAPFNIFLKHLISLKPHRYGFTVVLLQF